MSALAALTRQLALPAETANTEAADAASLRDLDATIARLGVRARAGSRGHESIDLQQDAVRRCWEGGRIDSLRDARLLAFGLDLPAGPDGARLLDDRARFEAVLAAADRWRATPHAYRRCYQGLLWTYFAHDPSSTDATAAAHAHWALLRAYLKARAPATRGTGANPDWVVALLRHAGVFGDAPAAGFTTRLLAGDRSELDAVCAQWGVSPASWFPRAAVQAQVLAATQRGHDEFAALLPAMLALLVASDPWQATGLGLLLERQAQVPHPLMHAGLRDALGTAWGRPWLVDASPHWEHVSETARALASEALKADLIERFCARVSDGSGPRRAAFWRRYTASMQHLEVVDAAMVLTIGGVRLVTSTDAAAALQGRDPRRDVDLQLFYRDGEGGWREWEQAFAAALHDVFALRLGSAPTAPPADFIDLADGRMHEPPPMPDTAPTAAPHWMHASAGEDVHWHTAEAASVPYSRPNLEVLARVHRLTLGTDADRAGSVTVSGDALDHRIATVLSRWGFVQTSARGWRRAGRERVALAA